ncbi:type IV pilus assembly protein PilM [bacterium]|nr:type IV pilus assembly protein PilM [candidate division CSSED10-310 bacterium]
MFRNRQFVGLDIGSSSVKAVVLKEGAKGSWSLLNLGIEQLPPEVIVDGTVMDTTVVVDAIRRLFISQKIKSKYVVISVSGHSVIVKKISLPQMSKEELEESIQWEAEQYIPFDIEDVNIDFHLMENFEESASSEMDVILVAVKKDKINDYVGLVRQAGLLPIIVDVDGFALYNEYELNTEQENANVALIDIGASVMNINIHQAGVHMLYRDITIGGNQYTDAIQKELNVSYEQAESLKMGEEVKGIHPDDVLGIIDSVNEDVTLEIQRSFDYFKATSQNANIDRVVLTGGCSKVKGLEQFLQEKLGTAVVRGNPFANITYNQKKIDPLYLQDISPFFAIAVGLGIRRD